MQFWRFSGLIAPHFRSVQAHSPGFKAARREDCWASPLLSSESIVELAYAVGFRKKRKTLKTKFLCGTRLGEPCRFLSMFACVLLNAVLFGLRLILMQYYIPVKI